MFCVIFKLNTEGQGSFSGLFLTLSYHMVYHMDFYTAQVVWTTFMVLFFDIPIIKKSPLDILLYIFTCDLKLEGEIPFE